MKRTKEIEEMIRKIDDSVFCIPTITDRILMNIAQSLAVIADALADEEGGQ